MEPVPVGVQAGQTGPGLDWLVAGIGSISADNQAEENGTLVESKYVYMRAVNHGVLRR
jgi:hypothetical protein